MLAAALYAWVTALYVASCCYFAFMLDRSRDWHGVPESIRPPFYVALTLAIVAHLVSMVWALVGADIKSKAALTVCATVYILACVLWLRLARLAVANRISKNWVRALLAFSVVPLIFICVDSFKVHMGAGLIALIPVLHASVLDVGVYGFRF